MDHRRRVLVGMALLLASGIIGCAGSRPEADLPPQYAAAPAAPTADPARTELEALPTGDEALDAFLIEIAGAFERHDWRALAYTLEPAAYAEQFQFFMNDDREAAEAVGQILEETFGVGTVGNTVYPNGLRRADRPFAGLERIQMVMIERVVPDGDFAEVQGTVVLDDRTSRALSFFVTQTTDGAYRVVVPMG